MLRPSCTVVVLLLLASSYTWASNDDPLALLQRMEQARQTLDYEGTFTYEHRSEMESFRVQHWVEGGKVHERLEYLNGPEGAVRQLGDPLLCHTTGYRLLHPDTSADDVARLDRFYQLTVRGEDRIAGRSVTIVEVRPRDQLRYGYLLGLDQETGLLLKSLLFDEHQRLLERFQFVELDLDPNVEQWTLQAQTSEPDIGNCAGGTREEPARWALNWLPPGFVYSGERQLSDNISMLMYTDGLASFSVFLQPLGSRTLNLEGRAQRGAISAFMGQLEAGDAYYRVTVVGEIPGGVAEQLARGIQPIGHHGRSTSEAAETP
ncbi:MucB/RseB C-terminal domain-containing protein [Marinimicrobium agarilyticum]|uniref:MucB/RseB C-terminal domain-containing protein n=1 Tax=Marinimicrobium agarilyticum TaxID=306546 RepID=UPI0004115F85|nr:MucB/RseB C-terminal domain-containing protein [Marinimicrobium agarilyticum]